MTNNCCNKCNMGPYKTCVDATCECHTQTTSLRERVLKELDPDFDSYTPDQGMPDTIWKLNDVQIDYIIQEAKAEERNDIAKREIEYWKKVFDSKPERTLASQKKELSQKIMDIEEPEDVGSDFVDGFCYLMNKVLGVLQD